MKGLYLILFLSFFITCSRDMNNTGFTEKNIKKVLEKQHSYSFQGKELLKLEDLPELGTKINIEVFEYTFSQTTSAITLFQINFTSPQAAISYEALSFLDWFAMKYDCSMRTTNGNSCIAISSKNVDVVKLDSIYLDLSKNFTDLVY